MAQLPETRVAVGTFLACLWTFLGLSLVARRNNTVKVQIEPSYGYSLAYEGLGIAFEEDNEEAALQLGLNLRNVGSGPLRYKFERFDVIVENRTIGRNVPLSGGFIPRAAARVYKHPAFRKQDIKDFIGTTANGFVEISVVYGNPELPPVRRLKMKIDVYMRLSTGFSIADNIVDESDEEI
jgi:hypothetical protein